MYYHIKKLGVIFIIWFVCLASVSAKPIEHIRSISDGNFANTKFSKPMDFNLEVFLGITDFTSASFLDDVEFNWVTFTKNTDFTRTQFNKTVDFYNTVFSGENSFVHADFYSMSSFISTEFSNVNFDYASFSNDVLFKNSRFTGFASFGGTNFITKASFIGLIFDGDASFDNAEFYKKVSFKNTVFNGNVSFIHTTLPDELDFSHVKSKHIIDFTDSLTPKLADRCKINLLGTDLGKIKMNYTNFILYFPKNTPEGEIGVVYQKLLNSFKQNGDITSYTKLFEEYSAYKYQLNNHFVWGWFNKVWWNYGLAPQRVFMWIFILLGVFSLVNACFFEFLLKKAFSFKFLLPDNSYLNKYRHYRHYFLIRFIDDLPSAVLYTILIFFGGFIGAKTEVERFKNRSLIINIYLLFIVICGLTLSMFVLRFIFTVV